MKERCRPVLRAFPYLFLPALILWLYWPALTGTFVLDDWQLLGPRAAGEFLGNPLSIFSSFQVVHFAPVARLFYSVLSVFFGTTPMPYHAVCLALLALLTILLYRFLLFQNVSPLPALFAAAYLAAVTSNVHVFLWITAGNYLMLGIFLVLAMWKWEQWLRGAGRKALLYSLGLGLLAQYTHTLGVLFPLLFLLRGFLAKGPRFSVSRNAALAWVGASFLGVLLLQGIPRLVLPGAWAHSRLNLDPVSILKAFLDSFTEMTVPAFLGGWVDRTFTGAPLPTPPLNIPGIVLAGLTLVAFLGWLAQRTHLRLIATGLLVVLGSWSLPVLLVPNLEALTHLSRYHFLANLGFSLVLASVFDFPSASPQAGRLARWGRRISWAAFLLFLFISAWNLPAIRDDLLRQDHFVRDTARGYVRQIQRALEKFPGQGLTVYDTQVSDAKPIEVAGDINMIHLDHATIHRFYFAGNPNALKRVTFVPYSLNKADPAAPPVKGSFLAFGPDLLYRE